MTFIERSELLSIEDILPFFPDFVVIDDFKNEICSALETYATKIESLKAEMEEASKSAQSIREDIDKLGSRFVTVDPQDKCNLCMEKLLDRQFYVFPCRHTFHADCLIAETTAHLPRRTLRRILYLQQQLSSMTYGAIPALPPSYASVVGDTQDGTMASRKSTVSLGMGIGSVAGGIGMGTGFDRLREIILPDAVISAISQGVSVGVAGGRRVLAPLDPFAEPTTNSAGQSGGRSASLALNGSRARTTGGLLSPMWARSGGAGGAANMDGGEMRSIDPSKLSIEDEEKIEILRDELDSLIASDCVLCQGALTMLNRPFVSDKEKASDEWTL